MDDFDSVYAFPETTLEDSSEAMIVLRNAGRLLSDAKFLCRSRRYATSFFLVTIFKEEIAKFCLLSGLVKGERKNLFGHNYKLQLFNEVYLRLGALSVYRRVMDEQGRTGSFEHFLKMIEIIRSDDNTVYDDKDLEVAETIGMYLVEKNLIFDFAYSRNGKINLEKQKSLYVDVLDDGTISTPESVNPEKVRSEIEAANHFLDLLENHFRR